MARSRRNPAWLAPLLAAVVPLVISGIGKVLGYGVSTFNALPREERRARLRQVLASKALYVTGGGPVVATAARKVAASPAALDAVLDTLERHGEKAVSASTGAAQALASRRLAGTGAAVKTNRRRRNSSLVGTANDRLGLTPYLRGDGAHDAVYRYIVSGALPADAAGRARLARVVEQAATSSYADTRHAGRELARVLTLPRTNGRKLKTDAEMIAFMFPGWRVESEDAREKVYRNNDLRASIVQKKGSAYAVPFTLYLWDKGYVDGYPFLPAAVAAAKEARARTNGRRRNHYHVGPAVAMVNRRRRNGLLSSQEEIAVMRAMWKHGGEAFDNDLIADGVNMAVVAELTRRGLLHRKAVRGVSPYGSANYAVTNEGIDAMLAAKMPVPGLWRDGKLHTNGRRRNGLLATAATFAAGAIAEKKLGVVDRATGLLKNPADPRRDEYLSLVASSARQVVRERQRSAGSSYHGDNERGLETALGMAEGMGYGKEARALARAILRDAPPVNLAPGVAWTRKKARAHRAATGDRNWPVRNPAGPVVFSKDATYDGRKRFEARVEGAPWDAPRITIEQAYGISKHGATRGQRLGPADAWEASIRGFTGRGGSTVRVLGRGTRAEMKKLATDLLARGVP